jgi:hypothetical protein
MVPGLVVHPFKRSGVDEATAAPLPDSWVRRPKTVEVTPLSSPWSQNVGQSRTFRRPVPHTFLQFMMIYRGEGGDNEDHEYFGELANI